MENRRFSKSRASCARTRKGPSRAPIAGGAFAQSPAKFSAKFASFCSLFCRLAVVAPFAQALQIPWVVKQTGIATVRNDMVDRYGPHTFPALGALPAKRLTKELFQSQGAPPSGVVEAVPLRTFGTLRPFGLVGRTPTLTGQYVAPRVPTGPHRLVGHRHHLRGQKKKPEPITSHLCVGYWLRLSKLWPFSISTMILLLQSRQYSSRPLASVSGWMRSSRLLRLHRGQASHPFSTVNILPRSRSDCNTFPSNDTKIIYSLKTENYIKGHGRGGLRLRLRLDLGADPVAHPLARYLINR